MLAQRQFRGTLPGKNIKVYSRVTNMLVEAAVPPSVFGLGAAIAGMIPPRESLEQVFAAMAMSVIFDTLYTQFMVRAST